MRWHYGRLFHRKKEVISATDWSGTEERSVLPEQNRIVISAVWKIFVRKLECRYCGVDRNYSNWKAMMLQENERKILVCVFRTRITIEKIKKSCEIKKEIYKRFSILSHNSFYILGKCSFLIYKTHCDVQGIVSSEIIIILRSCYRRHMHNKLFCLLVLHRSSDR